MLGGQDPRMRGEMYQALRGGNGTEGFIFSFGLIGMIMLKMKIDTLTKTYIN
jgi:hypothetical protein